VTRFIKPLTRIIKDRRRRPTHLQRHLLNPVAPFMAVECFRLVRALGVGAHRHVRHAARRLTGRWSTLHAAAHSVVAAHAVSPAMVCVLTGLAAIGAGGVVAGARAYGSSVPHEIHNPATTPSAFDPAGLGDDTLTLASFPSGGTGGAPEIPIPTDPREIDGSPDTLSLLDPSEIAASPGVPPFDPDEIDSSPDDPKGPVDPNRPVPAPEPAGISMFGPSLLTIVVLREAQKRCLQLKPAG
jgi:hypothetical protein